MYNSRSYLLQKPKKKARRKNKIIVIFIAFMLLILAVVFSVNLISTFNSIHNNADWARALRLQKNGDERVYLLYGIDLWGANPYVDRLIMLYHDPAGKNISLLYIPGNTMIGTEKNSPEPLGRLYRSLEEPAFIDLVQELTGVPVQHYVALNYRGIAIMGDYLGGIASGELGGEGGESDLLPRGKEQLSGFELYRYFLTADYHESPWEQLNRQQGVLASLWAKMEQKKFWQWPKMIRRFSPFLETDLTWRELTALRKQFAELDFAGMKQLSLPGKEEIVGGCLCWVPDMEAIRDLVHLFKEGEPVMPGEVRVEVLNGSGVEGLAAEIAGLLEREGFQVVSTGNADHFNYTATQVIALGENVEKARAAALHIPGTGVSMLHRYDPEAGIDVKVIIGSDYLEYSNSPETTPGR